MPPTENSTHIRIPPAPVLARVAYRQFCLQSALPDGEHWPEWAQLADDDRLPWLYVGLVVAAEVRKANEHE